MLLNVDGVEFSYESKGVLEGVTFRADSGEVLGILGQNGCGKTTLLKCINTSLRPGGGAVFLEGEDVLGMSKRKIAKKMAMVMQSTSMTFPFTVYETVMMGRYSRIGTLGNETSEDVRIVYDAMRDTNVLQFMDRSINELSGGERRRVLIARALVQEPKVLLLDEPTLHLDVNHQFELMNLITRLAKENSMLIVFVTHDIVLAARYCDRTIMMSDGRIVAAGPTAEVMTPRNLEEYFKVESDVHYDPRVGLNVILLGKAGASGDDAGCSARVPEAVRENV